MSTLDQNNEALTPEQETAAAVEAEQSASAETAAQAPTDTADADPAAAADAEPAVDAQPEAAAEPEAPADAGAEPEASAAEPTSDADAPAEAATEPDAPAAEPATDAPADAAAEPEAPAAEPGAGADEADAPAGEPEAAAAAPAAPEASAESESPAPTPQAVPRPAPGPRPTPRAIPRAAAPVAPVAAPVSATPVGDAEAWGRIEDDGSVSVREGDAWRVVGEYPDGTSAEALEYFARKFNDLEVRVVTLEQRLATGGASASDLRKQANALKGEVVGAAAVGDLVGLAGRLDALTGALAEASEEEAAANRAALDAAVAEREAIVVKVEQLSARDPQQVQWKQASAELDAIFAEWQAHQKTAARLPKSVAQALWKRFRDARATFERNRRSFFAQLDGQHKAARDAKSRIVEKAEALSARGEDGIPAYRALLDEWKSAGRAGRKTDDALWARFKAAGDVLYGARAERDEAEQAESAPRIAAREELLAEAKAVADEKDLVKARKLLTNIQDRWEGVGRIFPRDTERGLDGRMRQVEQDLKRREDVDWKNNDPRTKARANDMSQQLQDAIAGLEADLAAAEAKGDKRRIDEAREALEARRTWLRAIG